MLYEPFTQIRGLAVHPEVRRSASFMEGSARVDVDSPREHVLSSSDHLLTIFSQLKARSLVRAARVCKLWRNEQLRHEDTLWCVLVLAFEQAHPRLGDSA
eukprot:3912999-Prymnesium_polylepis.1